jgi:hypothetical protein
VLAASPSEAEVAFQKHIPGCNVKIPGEQPSPSFLETAKLRPGAARNYDL